MVVLAFAPSAHAADPFGPLDSRLFAAEPGLIYFEENGDIHALDPFEGGPKVITEGSEPAVSPDGERIAFLRGERLFVGDAAGGGTEPLLDGARGRPAWSPDGTRIAVIDGNAIRLVYLEGSGPATAAEGLDGLGETLAFSPEGTHLVFDQLGKIVVLEIESAARSEVAEGEQPAYGPEGDIVFVRSDRLWILERGVEEAESFSPPRASGEPSEFGHRRPAYAPDGSRIVFEREDGTRSWLTMAPVGGGEPTRLTPVDGRACCPSWASAPPPLPAVSISDAAATEGLTMVFVVRLREPADSEVTVLATTQPGTATSGDDFEAHATPVVIPAGETEATFHVFTVQDALDEPDETLTATIAAQGGAVIDDGVAEGTILDDDSVPLPAVSIADTAILEGFSLRFEISVPTLAPTDITVTATTSHGTAGSADYTHQSQAVTIPAGQTNVGFVVDTTDDTLDEPAETVTVTLSEPQGATIGDGTATGTIVDKSRLSVAAPQPVAEGGVLRFPVRLDHAAASQVTVRLSTEDGTATSATDYTAQTDVQIIIPAGQTEAFFEVTTREDFLDETDETVQAKVLGTNGPAFPAAFSATGTIQNKPPPTVSASPPPAVPEGTPLSFPVRLSAPRPGNVTVTLTTQDGTANAPGDYTATTATVTIPAGQTQAVFTVPTVDDGFDEPDETVTARITGTTNAFPTLLSTVGTITDNDEPLPVVRVEAPAAVDEGTALRFPLRLDRAAPGPVDIRLSTRDGTAAAPGDYTAQSLTLVRIPAGATEAFLEVPTQTDDLAESDETMRAEIKSTVNVAPGVLSATGTIRDAEGPVKLIPGRIFGGKRVSGKVLVRPPRGDEFLDLGALAGLPVGTRVDAREGVIELRSGGRARFSDGVFTLRKGATLVLNGRRLWADGKGGFVTQGRYATATSRDGRWLTENRAGFTRIKVKRGRVTVRGDGRTTMLRAGQALTVRR